jgi:hypothetical protein
MIDLPFGFPAIACCNAMRWLAAEPQKRGQFSASNSPWPPSQRRVCRAGHQYCRDPMQPFAIPSIDKGRRNRSTGSRFKGRAV